MNYPPSGMHTAREDFRRARQQAALQEIVGRLTGKPVELLSYEDVYRKLKATGSAERGLRDIPLDAIVGSVGRYTDFTRTFLPRQNSDEDRWAGVKAAATDMSASGLPPIEVYQIGEAYFVRDGNHRVSVARQMGATHVQAYVIEVRTRVPISPDTSPDELLLKAEYAEFLDHTKLDQLRPTADLTVTVPGQYEILENHIEVHRYFMGLDFQRDISYEEAVGHWYDEVYLPVVLAFRERGLLRHFPDRTETDLYLWVAEHRAALEEELGWRITAAAAAVDLSAREGANLQSAASRIFNAVLPAGLEAGPPAGAWRKDRLTARYTDRLFGDILVPMSGEDSGWFALEQAWRIAKLDSATLRGLHVVATEDEREGEAALKVRDHFLWRCGEVGVPGSLAIEAGEVTPKICERALLTDLVVVNMAYPPAPEPLARLSSGFRALLRRCARPVLAVPGVVTPLNSVLLAYDGSPRAEEALFVAAYAAGEWHLPLTVLTVLEGGRATDETLERARQYLEFHEISAALVRETGPADEAILRTADERQCDLIIMGGYGRAPMIEVVVGSAVDRVLREARKPVLICR